MTFRRPLPSATTATPSGPDAGLVSSRLSLPSAQSASKIIHCRQRRNRGGCFRSNMFERTPFASIAAAKQADRKFKKNRFGLVYFFLFFIFSAC